MSERDESIIACAHLCPDAVIVEDGAGTVVEYNNAAQQLFGYERGEVIGWPLGERIWAEPWPDSATPGRERLFRRSDGRTFIGDVSRARARTAQGSYVIYAVRDITAQKTVETRLREQCRASAESIAMAAHELRAPLNAIAGFCELLTDGESPRHSERDQEIIGCMSAASRHLLRLVNDILGAARRQARKAAASDDASPAPARPAPAAASDGDQPAGSL